MQRFAPALLEVRSAVFVPPKGADDLVAAARRFLQQRSEQFMPRLPAKERLDHRLHDCGRAVERTRIAPALQRVRFRSMPATDLRRFVVKQPDVYRPRDFRKQFGKLEICRRIVNWISTDDHKSVDCA